MSELELSVLSVVLESLIAGMSFGFVRLSINVNQRSFHP